MKRFRWILWILPTLWILCGVCFAADLEREQAESFGVDRMEKALPSEAEALLGEFRVSDAQDANALLDKLWSGILDRSGGVLHSALRGGTEVLITAMLASVCLAVADDRVLSAAGVTAIALVCVKGVSSCVAVGREAMESTVTFSHVLLPCLCTAAAAGGAWSSAGAKYAAAMLFLDGVITAERSVAMPLLCAFAGVLIAGEVADNALLRSISGLLRQLLKWALILITTVFTMYLSLTGLLSGTVDAAAAKAAKTAFSSALPVVGGILADASSSLLSGAQILRNGIGAFGMIAVLAVCAVPYLTLGSHYLVYRIAGGAVAALGDKRFGGVVSGLGDVFGILLGMVGSVSVMLFVSVVSLMRTVTPG